jgi:molybdopterin converting factor small subunit
MGKAEENYKYALNKDKYDSEVVEAVDKKSLKKKDANTVSKIQNMMQKEKEAKRKKKSREVVTSENRDEYMAKKLKLADKQEPVYKEEMGK